MSFLRSSGPPFLYASIPLLHFGFLSLILKSLFLVFKTVSWGPGLWNLTSSPKLRLHGNIVFFQVLSSEGSELNRTASFIWSFLSVGSGSAVSQQVFLHTPLSFLPVSSSLQICTTRLLGSKVLYTRKYYTRVESPTSHPTGPISDTTPKGRLFSRNTFPDGRVGDLLKSH